MRRPILNHTKRGELVYEPFLGSGTTLAAAELTERVCCGIELDPKYVEVVIQRSQTLSGKRPRSTEMAGRSTRFLKNAQGERREAKACQPPVPTGADSWRGSGGYPRPGTNRRGGCETGRTRKRNGESGERRTRGRNTRTNPWRKRGHAPLASPHGRFARNLRETLKAEGFDDTYKTPVAKDTE